MVFRLFGANEGRYAGRLLESVVAGGVSWVRVCVGLVSHAEIRVFRFDWIGLGFMKIMVCVGVLMLVVPQLFSVAVAAPSHALTAFGEAPKYPAGFSHFDYVNAEAPKGGEIAMSTDDPLRFSHLIPYAEDGQGVQEIDAWVYAPLAYPSLDEPMTVYGFVASGIEMAPDRSWLRFTLNKNARFEDGSPITAEDVAYSYELMSRKAAYSIRNGYSGVRDVVLEGERQIRFVFDGVPGRSLPMHIATMRVLPKHWWVKRNFEQGGGYEPPLGSGPYRVVKVVPGETVVFERNKNWWGANLPAAKGLFNFDRITLKVYGSREIAHQAMLAHDVDVGLEKQAPVLADGFHAAAAQDGELIRAKFPADTLYASGYWFNTRQGPLADVRVRKAVAMLWDFEWVNARLNHGTARRQTSMFGPADMQAHGLPDAAEAKILEPWRTQIPPEVFTQAFSVPVGDGSGNIRARQLEALRLLESAGWHSDGEVLRNTRGEPLAFSFLNINKGFERSLMAFKRSLAQIGVSFSIRTVDVAQYGMALQNRKYDMIYNSYPSPHTPGVELAGYFGSASAARPGTSNFTGIHSAAVDSLIDGVVHAQTRNELLTYAHALDRVLDWQYLWIPATRTNGSGYVFWNRFGLPAVQVANAPNLDAWWVKSDKAVPGGIPSIANREVLQ